MNLRSLNVLVVVAALLSGCTSPGKEPVVRTITPEPLPSRPTVAPSPVPVLGDVTRFNRRACDLLPDDQAVAFGASGTPDEVWSGFGAICTWSGKVRLMIAATSEEDSLAAAYRSSASTVEWEELTIGGQPAVRFSPAKPRTACHVVVGTAPGQAIDVDLSGDDPAVDWCGKSIAIAEKVLLNVKG
ncbi:DUF3558 domain-containing protein [Actinokineospora sp. HUAS TT18]|uniref:DUF3558 domain-containing protein n=1 Tax=Actinokineospora sp. HUAS TT18 TaxID=3447451 RepID=UPI003F51D4A6